MTTDPRKRTESTGTGTWTCVASNPSPHRDHLTSACSQHKWRIHPCFSNSEAMV